MYRLQSGGLAGEAHTDYGLVETDPTGRYVRSEEILGKGAMKTVYKAMDQVLGMEVAWNKVRLNDLLQSPEELQRLYSEVHLLSTLNHPSIIQFHTSWIDLRGRGFNFITEMFTSGSLRQYRKRYSRIDIRAVKRWARQILDGLVYLHGHDPLVIHRDLKCDNIFVNGHLGQVKIGDLGLATILRGSHHAHSVIGTPEFMAPELYEESYNELVDVYSFGMCVLEMLTSDYPYSECSNPAQIYKKVTQGKLPQAFYSVKDVEAQKFIGKCLESASKRLAAKELIHDSFLACDQDELFPPSKIGSQNPFLNGRRMEKSRIPHSVPSRTDMTITGKLNPEDDTIFLKVQTTDKDGSARNIYFPFDTLGDTPIDVATEMVKELEITDWEPMEIASMIEGEISALVPKWKNWSSDQPAEVDHAYYSFSSCSSSQTSFSGLITTNGIDETSCGAPDCLHDDLLDDNSSLSSSQSLQYSNLNYLSGPVPESDLSPTKGERSHHPVAMAHKSTRFCHDENQAKISIKQSKLLVNPQAIAADSKSKDKMVMDMRRLTRNRSLVDIRSQMLHRSLVEEVNKRRLFNTVGAVENIGFQAPCEVSTTRDGKRQASKGSKV